MGNRVRCSECTGPFGILLTTNVHAAARFEGSDASYVRSGETVDGSAYLAGTSVRVEGTINGDLYCAGKDIIITGTVNGDVLCGGMTLIVGGTVTGNIRLAGQKFVFHAVGTYTPVPGDLVIYDAGEMNSHVNIVSSVEGNKMKLIGGNQDGTSSWTTSKVTEWDSDFSNTYGQLIGGYVSPKE